MPQSLLLSGSEMFALDCYFNPSDPTTAHHMPSSKHGITPLSGTGHRAYLRMWRAKGDTNWLEVNEEDLHLDTTATGNAFTVNVCYPGTQEVTLSSVTVQLSTFYKNPDNDLAVYFDPSITLAGYAFSPGTGVALTTLPSLIPPQNSVTTAAPPSTTPFNWQPKMVTNPDGPAQTIMMCPAITFTFGNVCSPPAPAKNWSIGLIVYVTLTVSGSLISFFDDPKMEVTTGAK